ncbi:MAG: NEW3 domain-containing protein [Dongiaceae bacterium]
MRVHTLAAIVLAALTFGHFGHSALAANTPDPASSYKGLWVSTPYPSLGVSGGEPIELELTVHNSGMPPQRVALAASHLPDKWSALFLGGGRPVDSAFVAPDGTVDVTLRVVPPDGVNAGTYKFEVAATGDDGGDFNLPIELNFGQSMPARLNLSTELPALRGSPTSNFSYDVSSATKAGARPRRGLGVVAPGLPRHLQEGY